MTKLNMSAAAAAVAAPTATGAGVNKSMTRINASSQQNMARFSSSGQVRQYIELQIVVNSPICSVC